MKRSSRRTSPLAFYVTRRESKPFLALGEKDLAALAVHLPGKRCVIKFGTWRNRRRRTRPHARQS